MDTPRTNDSTCTSERSEEELRLPFEDGACHLTGDAPPPDLDANQRYRVIPDFPSNNLANHRCIRVYLPEAYLSEPSRRFPVFYLHDGQNLFDGRSSYVVNRTWRAHTTADRLVREGTTEPLILVGIDHTGTHRMEEYTPTRDMRMGGGEGPRYGRLITEELKPFIDSKLRTLNGSEHTGLGGSSLGGLISLFLGLEYPEVFGKLAVLSPSVWWNQRAILSLIQPVSPRPCIWLDMGMLEGLRHLRDCDVLHHRLKQRGWKASSLHYMRVPGGLHDEDAWAARFEHVLSFLFPRKSAAI